MSTTGTLNGSRGVGFYRSFLLFIAGLGGLLYGADIGIIAAALLYLNRTIDLSIEQTSLVVAAVLGGSMVSSLAAGMLADWMGRRKMMIVSGLMFVVSVAVIVMSQGFTSLFLGRLLQGMSGGVIAVVVPLYLAESLSANSRGRGTAIFQFMLTFGIVLAALIGWHFTRQAEAAIAAAAGNAGLIRAAENHAWRSMFLTVVYPGLLFFAGSFVLSETPRWLLRKGKRAAARASLMRTTPEHEAEAAWSEMEALTAKDAAAGAARASGGRDSLLRRKYVVPFVLACVVLTLTQTTGINSILSFLVIILRQAGMDAAHATQGDVAVKLMNCGMTLVAVALVDRKGRRFLLRLGTIGITIALLTAGVVFLRSQSAQVDVRSALQAAVRGDTLEVPVVGGEFGTGQAEANTGRPSSLTVVYSYGAGDHVATVVSGGSDSVLKIAPDRHLQGRPLIIRHARYGPVPGPATGWLVAGCLGVFILSYAVGPGVVVWLALSELMPTRIRSIGMGVALLLNQGMSTLIAALFLPVVGNYGYAAMFLFWSVCTFIYFLAVTFFLPETKGKTLEEIEMHFEGVNALEAGKA